jgi:hypothetical protein
VLGYTFHVQELKLTPCPRGFDLYTSSNVTKIEYKITEEHEKPQCLLMYPTIHVQARIFYAS